jgi:hypothetical protein
MLDIVFLTPKGPVTSMYRGRGAVRVFSEVNVSKQIIFLICELGGGIQGPLGTAATIRPTVPAPGDYDDGKIGEMIGRGN